MPRLAKMFSCNPSHLCAGCEHILKARQGAKDTRSCWLEDRHSEGQPCCQPLSDKRGQRSHIHLILEYGEAKSGYLLRSIMPGVVSGVESASDFRGVGFSIRTDTEVAVLTRSFRALRLVQYPTELAGSPIRIVCPRTNCTEERFTINLGVLSHCSGRKRAELQNPEIVDNKWEHAGHDYHELEAQEFTVHVPGQPFAKP